MPFTEENYENAIIELFQGMGYTHQYASDIERDYKSPLYDDVLISSLQAINPHLPTEGINNAIDKLQNFPSGSLVQKNELFTDYLQNGIEVKYFEQGEEKSNIAYLIDYSDTNKNSFKVIIASATKHL